MIYITYYIIYPSGDKSRLSVLDLADYESHELNDWSLASRQSFTVLDEAIEYAQVLANKHNKIYDGFESRHSDHNHHFLD